MPSGSTTVYSNVEIVVGDTTGLMPDPLSHLWIFLFIFYFFILADLSARLAFATDSVYKTTVAISLT